MRRLLFILTMTLFTVACTAQVSRYKLEVVKEFPHDEKSFTQGLFFHGGTLYESTGMYGESTFKTVELSTGKALKKLDFDRKYFLEGSVIMGDELFILTWENKLAFIYDASTLKYKASYSYPREGWGLTTDGKRLIASDGSAKLYFMDSKFKLSGTVTVKLNGRPVSNLNELEYIDGKIWANVYLTDMILIINPSTGNAEGVVDCSGLLPERLRDSRTDVLNGIAHDPQAKKTYLTGKYWKRLYEIKLVRK